MTQVTSKKPAGIETQSSSTPEVIVNRDALIIGNEFYLIDDIKDVEIKYMPWQVWIGLAAFLLTVYLYYFHPNMLVVSGYTTKAYHVTGLVAVLLGAWGKTEPAQMVIGLSGKRGPGVGTPRERTEGHP